MLALRTRRSALRLTTVALVAPALLATAPAPQAHAANCAPGDPAGTEFTAVLRSSRGLIVTAELEYGGATEGMLRARATRVGSWERFRVRCLGNAQIALRAANGKWVAAELGAGYTGTTSEGMLRARSTRIGRWETFRYRPVDGTSFGDGRVALESVANGRLVAAEFENEGSRQGMLRARSTERGSWETFTAEILTPAPPPPSPTPTPRPEPSPAPAPPPPADVHIPRGCVAAGKGVIVRVRAFRKRGRRPRIRSVRFMVRPGGERVVDRRAPFRSRLGERLAPGTVARVRARVMYRWKGQRRTRSRVLVGRIRICP
jgi:hypothetical protein